MADKVQTSVWWTLLAVAGMCLLTLFVFIKPTAAINQLPIPDPIPGSYGLAATKTQEPPTQGARITTPGNGSTFSNSPIRVSGICPNDLLVEIYNNGVMVGSVMCANGSFSLEISLFSGRNELTAVVYDSLEQAGPTSNVVTVNYTDTQFSAFGQLITLTSAYGRRSAPANTQLTWPLQLTGGTGPYAFSISWGDGSKAQLMSQSLAGPLNIARTYEKAGIYQVNVTVTDTNGVSAFLQVIAVSSGKADALVPNTGGDGSQRVVYVWVWIPAVIALVLLPLAFWLGRRSQLVSIHNRMLKERDNIKNNQ